MQRLTPDGPNWRRSCKRSAPNDLGCSGVGGAELQLDQVVMRRNPIWRVISKLHIIVTSVVPQQHSDHSGIEYGGLPVNHCISRRVSQRELFSRALQPAITLSIAGDSVEGVSLAGAAVREPESQRAEQIGFNIGSSQQD